MTYCSVVISIKMWVRVQFRFFFPIFFNLILVFLVLCCHEDDWKCLHINYRRNSLTAVGWTCLENICGVSVWNVAFAFRSKGWRSVWTSGVATWRTWPCWWSSRPTTSSPEAERSAPPRRRHAPLLLFLSPFFFFTLFWLSFVLLPSVVMTNLR